MKRFLVLSDERCGGTNLVRSLAENPEIRINEHSSQELRQQIGYTPNNQNEWINQYHTFWAQQSLWHVQRIHLPTGTGAWTGLISMEPRLICLYRENLELQYLSLKHAILTRRWHGNREAVSGAWWQPEDYGRVTGLWVAMRQYAKKVLPAEMCLWVSYEQLESDWDTAILECQKHLGVEPKLFGQAMTKPTPLDYHAIFGVTREEMQQYRYPLTNSQCPLPESPGCE